MSDSATLLAYLQEHAQPDGSFSQNAQTTAALIGFYPEQLSAAFQELAADGSIEATHAGGDPAKIHGSSWRVLDLPAAGAAGDELDGLGVKDLRALAKDLDVDVKGLKSKAELAGAIRAATGASDETEQQIDLLAELDANELAAFAKEHGIEIPEHSQDDPDEPATDAELRHAIQTVLDIRALEDAANGRTAAEADA